METKTKSEKCAVCFFMAGKPHINIVKTKDENLNKELVDLVFDYKK